jgi:hypothetical protein
MEREFVECSWNGWNSKSCANVLEIVFLGCSGNLLQIHWTFRNHCCWTETRGLWIPKVPEIKPFEQFKWTYQVFKSIVCWSPMRKNPLPKFHCVCPSNNIFRTKKGLGAFKFRKFVISCCFFIYFHSKSPQNSDLIQTFRVWECLFRRRKLLDFYCLLPLWHEIILGRTKRKLASK